MEQMSVLSWHRCQCCHGADISAFVHHNYTCATVIYLINAKVSEHHIIKNWMFKYPLEKLPGFCIIIDKSN